MIDNGNMTLAVILCALFLYVLAEERQSLLHTRTSPAASSQQQRRPQQQKQNSNNSGRNNHRDSLSNRSVQLCEIEDSECELSQVDLSIPEDV